MARYEGGSKGIYSGVERVVSRGVVEGWARAFDCARVGRECRGILTYGEEFAKYIEI